MDQLARRNAGAVRRGAARPRRNDSTARDHSRSSVDGSSTGGAGVRDTAGPEANLQTLARGINVVGLDSCSSDIIRLHAKLFKKHGVTTIRNFDALNNVENLDFTGRCIAAEGLKHEICVSLMGLPPGLTAATGMDAMAHCVETYLSKAVNPPADAIAFDGLRRASRFIERAVRDGSDREARWQMMSASMQGAMAFQKGLGAVHSLSHALGALPVRPHHGTLNAVLLPEVVKFNEAAVPGKVHDVAEVFGASGGAGLADALRELNRRIGLPSGLGAMGIAAETFPAVIANALKDHCHTTNPRQASADDYRRILEASA
mgnify:CR=1 FL=1